MTLLELFRPVLKSRAGKRGLRFGDDWHTFGDLDGKSDAVAYALSTQFGIRAGDRIAMYLGNGPDLVLYYLGGLKLGAIVVPINVMYRDRELTHVLRDAEPRIFLCDRNRYDVIAPQRESFDAIEHIFVCEDDVPDGTRPFRELTEGQPESRWSAPEVRGDDPALMIYTSGTTGRSKGALLTQANLASNIVALVESWQWTEQDRFLLCLPMFHVHGLCNGLHGALVTGCTTFLLPLFRADRVARTLDHEACTLFFGVPTMYERLLNCAAQGGPVPRHMRLYVSGSAPLSPDTFSRFKTVFGHEILERYGMSETVMITSNRYEGPRVQGSVGTPLPGVEIRIVDGDGREVAAGDTGEIQVRGPNVLQTYWRQPEMTREAFQDGWFRTGDLGRYDNNGNLILCGRQKELIISGGFNIYPQEIINCLADHPGVKETAVIGVPDPVQGELPKGYVVASDPELTEDRLMAYCRQRLAAFKVPKRFVFLDSLPRNAMGKLKVDDLPRRDEL
jgi:malonyl-CoA/methylmalonyl-CoA synthetase